MLRVLSGSLFVLLFPSTILVSTHLSPCYPPYFCHTPGTWNILDQQREQVLLDYNSALLSVSDLCARYTFYSLFAFQVPQILQISIEKGLCNLGTTAL